MTHAGSVGRVLAAGLLTLTAAACGNDDAPPDPDVWLAGATEHPGSWWDDWVAWAKAHGGQRKKPPPMGTAKHPPIADAPGAYIHEQ